MFAPESSRGEIFQNEDSALVGDIPVEEAGHAQVAQLEVGPPAGRREGEEGGKVVPASYRVTLLRGNNLPLTKFRHFWQLVGRNCSWLLPRQNGGTFQI